MQFEAILFLVLGIVAVIWTVLVILFPARIPPD